MIDWAESIIDYAPDCGPYSPESIQGTPISRDLLNPLQPSGEKYRIDVGDLLEVSVLTHDENTVTTVVVAPDGNIYYAFLPAIPAKGRTTEEVAADIESGMAKILVTPSVLVVPKVKASQYFVILGKVNAPGVFPLNTAVTLRQAIGDAGGLAFGSYNDTTISVANLKASFVERDGQRLNIDFDALLYKGAENQNIYLRPGDYIYIASALDQEVYILGAVPARMSPYTDGLTLLGALTPAYGPYSMDPYVYGNWKDVLIIRGSLECPCVIRVDFTRILSGDARDVYIYPGDIIYVPHKTARFGRMLIKLAIEAFVSSFVSNWASFEAGRLLQGSNSAGGI